MGRARVKIAVFFVLAIHCIGLMALLMQGCGQQKEPTTSRESVASNAPPAFVEQTNLPPPPPSNPPVVVAPPVTNEVPPPVVAPSAASDYTVVKGDILEKIAKNFHVSVKAILDANPGIEPAKLKIGQKIHIPTPSGPVPTTAGAAPSESGSVAGGQIHMVKSGENLTKIAGRYGISVKALRTANGLKTDSLRVGQKLKIPAKASALTPAPAAAEPVPAGGTSAPSTAPTGQ